MRNKSEARIQSDCYLWVHNNFSHLRGLLCLNYNNPVSEEQGAMLKAMGMQAGRSDMVFYFKSMTYHFEFKLPSETQSPAQIEWQAKIEAQGFKYFLIYSEEQFKELMLEIMNG